MNLPKTRPKHMLRYSPKPIEAYTKVLAGKPYGPAESKLLDTTEAWNLAYLSHDFVEAFQHKDPMFTTHIRRTLQSRLDGGGLGIGLDPRLLVGSLLSLPAPRFVYLLRGAPQVVATLPLFQAYGEGWLSTLLNRERLCVADEHIEHWVDDGTSADARAAAQVLDRMRRPPGPPKWLDLSGIL